MAAAEILELDLVPDSGDGDEPSDFKTIGKQLRQVLASQEELKRRVNENSTHVLRLHQMHDPLTWKKRAAILFVGAFAGTGTAALMMHLLFHAVVR